MVAHTIVASNTTDSLAGSIVARMPSPSVGPISDTARRYHAAITKPNGLVSSPLSYITLTSANIPTPLKESPFNKYKMNMFDPQNNIMLLTMKIIILRPEHEQQKLHKKREISNVITGL